MLCIIYKSNLELKECLNISFLISWNKILLKKVCYTIEISLKWFKLRKIANTSLNVMIRMQKQNSI